MKLVSIILQAIVLSTLAILVRGQGSISTNKTSYLYNESIAITWSYTNGLDRDWIAVYPSSTPTPLPSGSAMWVYVRSLTKTSMAGTRLSGTVAFDSKLPDESGTQTWPLSIGSYKVHIVRNSSAPYPSVVSSAPFTVTAAPSAPTAPIPTAPVGTISTNKTSYVYNEPITISWSYTNALDGDWVALYPDSTESPLPSGSSMWVYTRSLTQYLMNGTRLSGSVTFDANEPLEKGRQAWPLSLGAYRVHIARNSKAPYAAVVSSATFSVTAAPPAVAPTVAPTTQPCGLFGWSIFCPLTFCGVFGRWLGLCRSE